LFELISIVFLLFDEARVAPDHEVPGAVAACRGDGQAQFGDALNWHIDSGRGRVAFDGVEADEGSSVARYGGSTLHT